VARLAATYGITPDVVRDLIEAHGRFVRQARGIGSAFRSP